MNVYSMLESSRGYLAAGSLPGAAYSLSTRYLSSRAFIVFLSVSSRSSLDALYATLTWLNGFSGAFWNCLWMISRIWFWRSPGCWGQPARHTTHVLLELGHLALEVRGKRGLVPLLGVPLDLARLRSVSPPPGPPWTPWPGRSSWR